MGKQIGSDATINRLRTRVLDTFPQTYNITKPSRQLQPSGTYKIVAGTKLMWNGLEDIPCRLDISSHYRSSNVFAQEDIINEFTLNVPYDAPLIQDHTITIDGNDYEIQKLLDTHGYNIAKQALVSRVDIGKS